MLNKNIQRKGIGKHIIKKILNLYKSMDYKSCHIGVIDSNIEAIKFWNKIGFNENGTIYTHDKYNVIMMDFIL
jgi:ribosomal protein S18 acetylase RimI-like enzyme